MTNSISLLIMTITISLSLIMPASFAMTQTAEQALSTHNNLRNQHQAPALQWDEKLAAYAQRHAAKCVFKHSHGKYGENLAAGYPDITTAIKAWYSEINDYSYQHPQFSYATGHFTQLIWQSSTKLGCATAICNGRNNTPGEYLVCEYSPAGNIIGEKYFRQNVRRKIP